MSSLRLRGLPDDLLVVDAFRASRAEREAAMPSTVASSYVQMCARTLDAKALAELYALAFDHSFENVRVAAPREVIVRRVLEAVEMGRLLVRRKDAQGKLPRAR
jgi:hypothetical protein